MQKIKPVYIFTTFLTAASLLLQAAVFADSAEMVSIFVVKGRNIGPYNSVSLSLKQTLQGRSAGVKITEFNFEDDRDGTQIKGKLSEIKPSLVITLGTPATKAVRQISSDTPVVYTMILNPEKSGIGPPGVAMDISPELKLKKLQKILPFARKMGVIYSPEYRSSFEEVKRSCARLGFEAIGRQVSQQKDFPAALEEVLKQADCFFMVADPNIYIAKTTEYLLIQALQRKVPVVGLSSSYTKAGALIAFDCDYEDLGRQTATLALKVMNRDAASLRLAELPGKTRLSLNILIARRLGIELSSEIMNEASEVFGK